MSERSNDSGVDPRPIPHDQLLKTLLLAFLIDLVDLVDPALALRLDPDQLEPLDKEVFTDLPRGERREVDLLVRARLREGGLRIVLIHVEIEANHRRSHPARMADYYLQVRGRHPGEPILPIAVYLKGGPPGHQVLSWSDSVAGFETLRFRYHALGLSRDLADHHLDRKNPLGWALAALMRSRAHRPDDLKLECLRRIARAGLDQARTFLLVSIVETYLVLTEPEHARYNKKLAEEANEEVRTMQQTWEEQHYYRGHRQGREEGIARGREEGIEQGREEGIAHGRLEGSRRTLIRLIEGRFGSLSPRAREVLGAIGDVSVLDRLTARLVDAESVEELGLDD